MISTVLESLSQVAPCVASERWCAEPRVCSVLPCAARAWLLLPSTPPDVTPPRITFPHLDPSLTEGAARQVRVLPRPVFPYRRVRIQRDQGRGG
jgi:hypothetical protein